MSTTITQLCIAAEALDAYLFVKVGTAEKVADMAAITDVPLGITCAPATADGDEVGIAVSGYALVEFAEAVAPFTKFGSNAAGKAVEADTQNQAIVGYYAPEPVDGAMPDSPAAGRARVYLYADKSTLVP